MHISIATSNGKLFNLEVDSADSVHQIKQKIHILAGIPSEQQKLLWGGKLLEDLQTIAEYNVEKDFLITLKVNEIKIQIKSIGESNFTVDAELTDTIQVLKAKIQNLKGISSEDFVLSFKGKKLEKEEATLTSLGLKDKSVLLIVRKTSSKANLLSSPTLSTRNCLNRCGFFGNAVTNGYCSKCFHALGMAPPSPFVSRNENNNNKNNNNNNNNNPPPPYFPSVDPPQYYDSFNNNNNLNVQNVDKENQNNDNRHNISIDDDQKKEDKKVQLDTSKCWKCCKKIGIYGFQCRCKFHFCDKHRYNDRHNCSFDYTEFQRTNLIVKLEKVVERKVEEI